MASHSIDGQHRPTGSRKGPGVHRVTGVKLSPAVAGSALVSNQVVGGDSFSVPGGTDPGLACERPTGTSLCCGLMLTLGAVLGVIALSSVVVLWYGSVSVRSCVGAFSCVSFVCVLIQVFRDRRVLAMVRQHCRSSINGVQRALLPSCVGMILVSCVMLAYGRRNGFDLVDYFESSVILVVLGLVAFSLIAGFCDWLEMATLSVVVLGSAGLFWYDGLSCLCFVCSLAAFAVYFGTVPTSLRTAVALKKLRDVVSDQDMDYLVTSVAIGSRVGMKEVSRDDLVVLVGEIEEVATTCKSSNEAAIKVTDKCMRHSEGLNPKWSKAVAVAMITVVLGLVYTHWDTISFLAMNSKDKLKEFFRRVYRALGSKKVVPADGGEDCLAIDAVTEEDTVAKEEVKQQRNSLFKGWRCNLMQCTEHQGVGCHFCFTESLAGFTLNEQGAHSICGHKSNCRYLWYPNRHITCEDPHVVFKCTCGESGKRGAPEVGRYKTAGQLLIGFNTADHLASSDVQWVRYSEGDKFVWKRNYARGSVLMDQQFDEKVSNPTAFEEDGDSDVQSSAVQSGEFGVVSVFGRELFNVLGMRLVGSIIGLVWATHNLYTRWSDVLQWWRGQHWVTKLAIGIGVAAALHAFYESITRVEKVERRRYRKALHYSQVNGGECECGCPELLLSAHTGETKCWTCHELQSEVNVDGHQKKKWSRRSKSKYFYLQESGVVSSDVPLTVSGARKRILVRAEDPDESADSTLADPTEKVKTVTSETLPGGTLSKQAGIPIKSWMSSIVTLNSTSGKMRSGFVVSDIIFTTQHGGDTCSIRSVHGEVADISPLMTSKEGVIDWSVYAKPSAWGGSVFKTHMIATPTLGESVFVVKGDEIAIAWIFQIQKHQVHYSFENGHSEGGWSGCPVIAFRDGQPRLVGIHSAGSPTQRVGSAQNLVQVLADMKLLMIEPSHEAVPQVEASFVLMVFLTVFFGHVVVYSGCKQAIADSVAEKARQQACGRDVRKHNVVTCQTGLAEQDEEWKGCKHFKCPTGLRSGDGPCNVSCAGQACTHVPGCLKLLLCSTVPTAPQKVSENVLAVEPLAPLVVAPDVVETKKGKKKNPVRMCVVCSTPVGRKQPKHVIRCSSCQKVALLQSVQVTAPTNVAAPTKPPLKPVVESEAMKMARLGITAPSAAQCKDFLYPPRSPRGDCRLAP